MYDWLVDHKIPLGSWVKSFVDLLNEHAQAVFDFISLVIGAWIDGLTAILVAVPPLLLIGIFAGLFEFGIRWLERVPVPWKGKV